MDYEYEKKDVRELFRDITNYEIIPQSVFIENRCEIEKLLEIINSEYAPNIDTLKRKSQKIEKLKTKIRLKDFVLNLAGYEIEKKKLFSERINKINLGKTENIYIINCEYSSDRDYRKDIEEEEIIFEDRCF